jgi:hypothetical protein
MAAALRHPPLPTLAAGSQWTVCQFRTSRTVNMLRRGRGQSTAAPSPTPDHALPRPPPAGFWSTSISLTDVLRRAALYELYAAIVGLAIALLFAYNALFRLSLAPIPRLVLLCSCPVYYPVLLSANAAVFAILSAARKNLAQLESALARVADAVTAPVLRALPAARISLADLRARLLSSGESVKTTEASSRGGGRGPVGLASQMMLGAAVRTVLFALERRYAGVIQDGGMIGCQTVKSVLTGELVGALMSPFSSTLAAYSAMVVAETVSLSVLPFIVAWGLSRHPLPSPPLSARLL